VRGVIRCVRTFGRGLNEVRGEGMQTCPKCHAHVPQQMRFCLQCGAALSPPPPAARVAAPMQDGEPSPLAPKNVAPPHRAVPTVPLKIAPTPVIAPRVGSGADHPPRRLSAPMVEVDDESLKKNFERPPSQPGAVLCRFCKGPLDLAGDFCDQCGAPVPEAAPPGTFKSVPQPAAPPVPPPAAPAPLPATPMQAAPPEPPPVGSAPVDPPSAAPPLTPDPVTQPEPPSPTPAPAAPTPPAEAPPSGLMGRLKGLFKKG
jgi:hypothetical protein